MLFGDPAQFAIECEIAQQSDGDMLVHFRFWFNNLALGDFSDYASLRACVIGLNEFLNYAGNRYEPDLEGKTPEEIFALVYDKIIFTPPPGTSLVEVIGNDKVTDVGRYESPPYTDQRNRFHLDYVGASAFADSVSAILIETADGHGRAIWRDLKSHVLHTIVLRPGEFERVADEFLRWCCRPEIMTP